MKYLKLPVYFTIAFLSVLLPLSNASASNLILDSFFASPSPVNAGDTSLWTLGLSLNATNAGEQLSSANLTFSSGNGQTSLFSGPLTGSTASVGESFTYGAAGTYFGSVSGNVLSSWQTNAPIYGTVLDYAWVWHPYTCGIFGCFGDSGYSSYDVIGSHQALLGYDTTVYTETFSIDGLVSGQLSTSWDTSATYSSIVADYAWVWHPYTCGIFGCFGDSGYSSYDVVGYHTVYQTVVTPHTQTLSINGLTVNGAQISAVPEPETYAMLLAGLGLLGFTARRRKEHVA